MHVLTDTVKHTEIISGQSKMYFFLVNTVGRSIVNIAKELKKRIKI